MYTSEIQIRVHYAATDQMGVVYHGRYAEFMEIGRVEALRQLGIRYKDIEESGVIMVVTEMNIRYLRPAKYDDLLTVVTTVREYPAGYKMTFYTEIFNEQKTLLTAGRVTLIYIDTQTNKKTNMPDVIAEKLKKYFA